MAKKRHPACSGELGWLSGHGLGLGLGLGFWRASLPILEVLYFMPDAWLHTYTQVEDAPLIMS